MSINNVEASISDAFLTREPLHQERRVERAFFEAGKALAELRDVGEFSCTVTMWDGEYTVRIDHLKLLNYLESECQQMQQISDRISRLRDGNKLEAPAEAVLKCLGELKRPYLTAIHSSVSAMDGWLVLWKIKIAVMIAPAIAVKIMAVLQDGFMLLALLSQY